MSKADAGVSARGDATVLPRKKLVTGEYIRRIKKQGNFLRLLLLHVSSGGEIRTEYRLLTQEQYREQLSPHFATDEERIR
jgi:hypothetical protein